MAMAPRGMFRQGMNATEREAAREKLADWYAERGIDEEIMLRRGHMSAECGGRWPGHSLCQAEEPGGSGCVCSHHDDELGVGALVPGRPSGPPVLAVVAL